VADEVVEGNGFGLGDVAVPECSIELQMFKIYKKCQKKY